LGGGGKKEGSRHRIWKVERQEKSPTGRIKKGNRPRKGTDRGRRSIEHFNNLSTAKRKGDERKDEKTPKRKKTGGNSGELGSLLSIQALQVRKRKDVHQSGGKGNERKSNSGERGDTRGTTVTKKRGHASGFKFSNTSKAGKREGTQKIVPTGKKKTGKRTKSTK